MLARSATILTQIIFYTTRTQQPNLLTFSHIRSFFSQVEYVLKCDMSALQRRMYTHMAKHNVVLTDEADTHVKKVGEWRQSAWMWVVMVVWRVGDDGVAVVSMFFWWWWCFASCVSTRMLDYGCLS